MAQKIVASLAIFLAATPVLADAQAELEFARAIERWDGALRRHVDSGRVTRATIHGELGEICAGRLAGREADKETCLFWHRGLSTSDIALGSAMLAKAERLGIGHTLPYA